MLSQQKALRTFIFGMLLSLAQPAATAFAVEHSAAATVQASVLSPRLSDLEQRLFAQVREGSFGRVSLLAAGLIAGGIERDEDLRRYCRRFDALAASLRSSGVVRGTPREQAQAIFEYLHRETLTGGYCLQASDLRQAFDRGRFNCVTSSLLLNCLARRFGLKAVALELPGHALSRLELPRETIDVETTCPQWFNMAATLPLPDTRPRELSDVELVATIYYNRGVDLLAERRFADAVAANAKAVRLDPRNATAKGNYLATINNWGIELATDGRYAKAAELFRLGMSADPGFAAFHVNYDRLLRQWDAAKRENHDSNPPNEPAVLPLPAAVH
jgi:tetratricopeptide (TPR) repeat protein